MNDHQKLIIRHRLGIAVQKLVLQNMQDASGETVDSLRQLGVSADIEYYIVQKISSGKKDPQFTTLVSIAAGFNIPVSDLAAMFQTITDEEALMQIEKQKRDAKKKAAKKK
ncbi:hypothetical protein LZZ85_02495 [Terrimonas sp. NA20]|uniref:HTH cro/C1-type domain-containing protein n=1 Tax=Terrimonas ginsenosidimutans TaxID=2908004 RepID=A0ABS9KLD7_9BACT|nr:hypothetical protein [Terrimonas ginsenosidimutans]MCG2613124.1 hypothetical protein [Terrimonas ginsenosidimutans]